MSALTGGEVECLFHCSLQCCTPPLWHPLPGLMGSTFSHPQTVQSGGSMQAAARGCVLRLSGSGP